MNNTESSHFEALYPASSWKQEIEQIFSFIKTGKSAQLIGIPGSGKHNLMRLLAYNRNVRIEHVGDNQKWFHFVYLDFSEMKKRDLCDVIKFMLISLCYSVEERGLTADYEVLNGFLKEALPLQDELVYFQALKKSIDYLSLQKELTVIFLIDKFEVYLPTISEQFFINLQILRDRAKYRFSTIFALRHPLEDLLEASLYAEFKEYVLENTIYLKLYDKPSVDFRLSYLEKVTSKKLPDALKEQLQTVTAGLGKLTYASYEALLSENVQSFSEKDLKDFLLNKERIIAIFENILEILLPSERRVLYQTLHSSSENSTYLEKAGLIQNGKLTIPLFEEFLRKNPQTTTTHITYKHELNELYKGDEILSDKLSGSEFRLLKFLVTNPERIIEKEELITNVWKDTKTQEGVTDQAFDQILYRLRKKVEDDPNNPTHIQTIKGRGVKFSS